MRKINQNSINAFMNAQEYREGNTKVSSSNWNTYLYLHDNIIAIKDKETDQIKITTAGWNTNTTKSRLNAISNVNITTKKGVMFLNGVEWDGSLIDIL